MDVSLLNCGFDSRQLDFDKDYVAEGKYGRISSILSDSKKYITKLIHNPSASDKKLSRSIRELFMAKLASALGVGPTVCQPFGYDGVVFKDGLEYAMEECEPFESVELTDERIEKLKGDLQLLHSLQICHCDIKPANLAWSASKGKFVFLDFGMTRFVLEPAGYLSLTRFMGTHPFASPQMKKLYLLNSKGLVDLYFNDAYGLEQSLKQHQGRQGPEKEEEYDLSEFDR